MATMDELVAAATAGNEAAFATLVDRHRRELHVHCYRMLGSFEEAEDRVQEAFLRAWRKRSSFEGRSSYRTWLYRIATNVCLETIRRPVLATSALESGDRLPPYSAMPWLQPYPDVLLEEGPDAAVIAKETIALAFLAAIQLLPPRQRAVLILRDVLAFSAAETADLLESSVAGVNSALQRARDTMQKYQQAGDADSGPVATPTDDELALVQKFMDAHEHADPAAVIALLREDARLTISPMQMCWEGRDEIAQDFMESMNLLGEFRCVATSANRQPAVANYLRAWGDTEYKPFTLVLLGIENGQIVEFTTFASPELFAAFGLPERV